MSLPRAISHCVSNLSLNSINYVTDQWGGRIISNGSHSFPASVIFGESQALGMDTNELPRLYKQFDVESVVIYAAPNNGPYESYRRIALGNYQKNHYYMMVLNLGFDLFRLGNDWDPTRNNSISLEQVEKWIESPRWVTFNNFLRSFKGEAVGLSGDDRKFKLNLYNQHRVEILQNLETYLSEFHPKTIARLGQLETIVIMPYWMSDPMERKTLEAVIYRSACKKLTSSSTWTLAQKNYADNAVTKDKRHYKSETTFEIKPLQVCK
jgi:hypothetical protein